MKAASTGISSIPYDKNGNVKSMAEARRRTMQVAIDWPVHAVRACTITPDIDPDTLGAKQFAKLAEAAEQILPFEFLAAHLERLGSESTAKER